MDAEARAPLARRLIGRILGIAIVVSAALTSVYVYRVNFVHPRTDDAAVRANIVGIAPHVSGPIVDLRVVDNQSVRAGDLLFVVDPRPYQARLERLRAELALTIKEVDAQRSAIGAAAAEIARREAGLAAATAEVARRQTDVPAAEDAVSRAEAERAAAVATVTRLEADLAYADDYLRRVEPLLAREFVTADRVSDARSKRDAAEAAVVEARRRVQSAEAALREARTRRPAAAAALDQARAAQQQAARGIEQAQHDHVRSQELLAQVGPVNARQQAAEAAVRSAELDVDYCYVRAPFDAYVTNLNIAVGEYARQGQQIFALVDNRAWYVLANFRETYMPSIKPGMEAEVYLLTYPGRPFRGVVQGIGWANRPEDTTVGVLPDVPRTLNWVRLANRFPVRILLEDRDPDRPFRMSTSAVVTILGFPAAGSSRPRR